MLKDIVIEERVISYGEAEFTIRGLTLEDIAALLRPYRDEITRLFEGKLKVEEALLQFPVMSSTIIAYAASEPGQASKVRKLPIKIQLDALMAIWELTVLDEEDFLGKLKTLATGISGAAGKVNSLAKAMPIQVGNTN